MCSIDSYPITTWISCRKHNEFPIKFSNYRPNAHKHIALHNVKVFDCTSYKFDCHPNFEKRAQFLVY